MRDWLWIAKVKEALHHPGNTGELIQYQSDNSLSLEARLENETVWLNRHQMTIR